MRGDSEITAVWLTQTLKSAGVLVNGRVVAVEQQDNPAFNSIVKHLTLTYSEEVSNLPAHLLLKLKDKHHGQDEVAFYLLPEVADGRLGMMARSYAAQYEAESGDSFLLLNDYSQTHISPIPNRGHLSGRNIPSAAHLTQIIEALAGFHAFWWEHPRLGGLQAPFKISSWWADQAHFDDLIQAWSGYWQDFIEKESTWFPKPLQVLYEGALAKLPRLWQAHIVPRIQAREQVTLTNGDCYFNQFLCPQDSSTQNTLMVDLESACADFAAHDLIYLLPIFWTPAQRYYQNREMSLLKQYHQALQRGGVSTYLWAELLFDYRLMLTFMIFHPVWDYSYQGSDAYYWWLKMQCLLGAYQDLDCASL